MRSVVLGILIAMCSAGAVNAGQAEPQRAATRSERLEQWLAAVASHEPGMFDTAAREIAGWPDEHLLGVVKDVGELSRFLLRAQIHFRRTGEPSTTNVSGDRRLTFREIQQLFGLTDDETAQGNVSRLTMRAALMHTDITVHLHEHDLLARPRDPGTARTVLLVLDGKQEGIVDTGPHWDIARALLDLLDLAPPGPLRLAQRRDWYVATAAFMHSRAHLAPLLPHLNHAGRLLPADAEVLFYCGSMHETLASPTIQQAIRRLSVPAPVTTSVRDARTHLERARGCLQRAVESDPNHVEARVRLGAVLGALDRDAEALRELQRAGAGATTPRLQYYAAIFLGAAETRLGRAAKAREAYERAAALYPKAQTPRLGLSGLARAAGDRATASRALLTALPPRHDANAADPWWAYLGAPMDRADQLLLEWRRSVPHWPAP